MGYTFKKSVPAEVVKVLNSALHLPLWQYHILVNEMDRLNKTKG